MRSGFNVLLTREKGLAIYIITLRVSKSTSHMTRFDQGSVATFILTLYFLAMKRLIIFEIMPILFKSNHFQYGLFEFQKAIFIKQITLFKI